MRGVDLTTKLRMVPAPRARPKSVSDGGVKTGEKDIFTPFLKLIPHSLVTSIRRPKKKISL